MTKQIDDQSNDEHELLSRRRWMRTVIAAGVALSIAGVGVSKIAIAHDDNDDDDSGHDSDDDHDDDDRNDDFDDSHDDDHATQASSSQVADVTTIEIRDETYIPAHIIIDPGQTVTWNNLDDDEHTATGATFDTGELDRGDSSQIRFDTPGVYAFVCRYHSHMQGSVTVRGDVATPIASPEASPASAGETASVSIVDLAFNPPDLIVTKGTKVVWTNTGQIPHTVTGKFYSSDILQPADTAEYVFTSAGTFTYVCALHDGMSGTVTVA
ncbi:hypothetical protein BH09CHL1_BH09CHL1_21590 [soil metagenome]